MTGGPIISLRNVGVAYLRSRRILRQDPFWALKDVSFDLHQGEVLGVVGRNGAGKSTLLQLLADIIRPDRGTLVNRGVRAELLTLRLGFIPHLSGRENVILSGLLLGYRRTDLLKRMDDIVAFAELEDFIDQPLKTYSSGMGARLGFSVALQLNPDVLLIDEVLGVGDSEFREKSATALRNKIKSGMTAVLVSHSAGLVRRLCDRAVWIEHGKTVMEGDTETVMNAYTGSMNTSGQAVAARP